MNASGFQVLNEGFDFFEEEFLHINQDNISVVNKQFENCVFRKARFSKCVFAQCTFMDCTFDECDLSSLKVVNSSFRDVHFLRSKLMGIDWSEANVHMGFDVHFEDCVLDYTNFCRMNLSGLRVTSSRMHDARLDDTRLKGARFSGADLEGSSMRRADLRKANLSGVHHLAMDLSTCQLGGTKISLDSAYSSLALLGVQIGD